MSYHKKTRFGQYVQVAAMGADDPWAEAASGEVKQVTGGAQSEGGGLFDFIFGSSKPSTPTPTAPPKPSTVSQVGAGVAAFLKTLGAPAAPAPTAPIMPVQAGMSTTTKLALAGGGALVLVLLLTRD